jgi:hypothetical protein
MPSPTAARASETAPISLPSGWRGLAILLIALVAPLWHLHIINRDMPPNKADMVAVWKGAQFAFHGQNPYLDATTREIQRFYYGRPLTSADNVNPMGYAYPMHTILLLAPIALMPWHVVRIGFFILLPIVTMASVLLWLRVVQLRPSRKTVAIAVFLSLCSWPSMWAIHQIQPSLLVAALAAAGCFLITREQYTAAGILFAMATIKPQLIGILFAWLLLWTVLRGVWSFFLSFAVTLAALLAAATWLLPNWVSGWLQASSEYAAYRHLQLDLQFVFGHWIGLALAALLAAFGFRILWQYRDCPPASREFGMMCALCLALTLCLLPTERAMVYNHVFLFPACFLLFDAKPDTYSFSLARLLGVGIIFWSFLSMPIAVLGETFTGSSDFWDGLPCMTLLLPTAVLVALAFPFLQQIFAQHRTVQFETA